MPMNSIASPEGEKHLKDGRRVRFSKTVQEPRQTERDAPTAVALSTEQKAEYQQQQRAALALELLLIALEEDDKGGYSSLLYDGTYPAARLGAVVTVNKQRVTLGGHLAREAARSGQCWALAALGAVEDGGRDALVAFATDAAQTPIFFGFVRGECCNVIIQPVPAEQARLDTLMADRNDPDSGDDMPPPAFGDEDY